MPFSVGNHLVSQEDLVEALTYPTFAAAQHALIDELITKAAWACSGGTTHKAAGVCELGCACSYERAAQAVGRWSSPGTVQVDKLVYWIKEISEREFVSTQVAEAADERRDAVPDAVARIIAGWYGGQGTALYAFTSTGAIDRPRLMIEISRRQKRAYVFGDLDAAGRPPVPGWSDNSWE